MEWMTNIFGVVVHDACRHTKKTGFSEHRCLPNYMTSYTRIPKTWYIPERETDISYGCTMVFLRQSETLQEICGGDYEHCKQNKCSEGDSECHKEDMRPRRTSTTGTWSGLRIRINTFPEHIPPHHESDKTAGVLVSSPTAIWIRVIVSAWSE